MKKIEALLWGFSCGVTFCTISDRLVKDFGDSRQIVSTPVKSTMTPKLNGKEPNPAVFSIAKTIHYPH